ncbi:MAG TPA: hypothetical protein VFT70_18065 [Nocardioides sp.]|nr:hypothetical protein [Nocardioides sp.]
MTAWVWPTARSISWAPLAVVAACLAAVTVAVDRWVGRWPADLLGIAAAAVAGAQVAALRDPAATLLSALPTSPAVRRARRLAMLVPVALAVWLVTAGGPVLGLLALTAVGVAVSVRAGVPLGVAVPLAWVVLAWAGGFDWELR